MCAKTKYDPHITPQLVKWMRRSGLTDVEIADQINIDVRTLYRWKDRFPQIRQALKESANFVDSLVEDSLLKRALGYEIIEEEFKRGRDGMTIRVKKTRKHVVPDTVACIYWLKNRQPLRWRATEGRGDGEDKSSIPELVNLLQGLREAPADV